MNMSLHAIHTDCLARLHAHNMHAPHNTSLAVLDAIAPLVRPACSNILTWKTHTQCDVQCNSVPHLRHSVYPRTLGLGSGLQAPGRAGAWHAGIYQALQLAGHVAVDAIRHAPAGSSSITSYLEKPCKLKVLPPSVICICLLNAPLQADIHACKQCKHACI